MRDSNLVRVLARQSRAGVGHEEVTEIDRARGLREGRGDERDRLAGILPQGVGDRADIPMRDSNLVRVLARQSRAGVGLVDLATVAQGAEAVGASASGTMPTKR
jgi:uncharacterized protein YgbK (DUF1537 family)